MQAPFLNAVLYKDLCLYNSILSDLLYFTPKDSETVCGYFIPEDVRCP